MDLDVLFLNFVKAFGNVAHRSLLEKYRGLGPDGKLPEWIRVWLEENKQRVVLNGVASDWVDVLSLLRTGLNTV